MIATAQRNAPLIYSRKMTSTLDKFIRWSIYGLVLMLPISNSAVEAFSGLAILFFLIKKITLAIRPDAEEYPPRTRPSWLPRKTVLDIPIALYLAAVLLSVIFSLYPASSLEAFLTKVMQSVLLYFVITDTFRTSMEMRVVFKIFVIAVVVTCLNGLIQYLFGMDLLREKPLENNRVQSSFRHANDLGAYLALSVPILFTYWLSCYNGWRTRRGKEGSGEARRKMVIAGSITVLAMLLLGLTFSRSSWLGFLIAFGFWVVAARKNLAVTLIVVAGFMMVFFPMLIQVRNASFISDGVQGDQRKIQRKLEGDKVTRWTRIKEQLTISKRRFSAAGRTNFWNAATEVIKAKPVFGIGLNAYSKYFREHQLKYGGYPHNCYLQMAAETGLLGLGAFLFLAGSFFWRILQSVPQVDTAEALIFLGGAAGTLAFLVQSFFDTTLYNIQLAPVPWLMWGFLMVLRSQLAKN